MVLEAVPPDLDLLETPEGGSGVTLLGGTLWRIEDYNQDLNGQNGTRIFEKMRRGDPDISSGLSRLIWPLLSADWHFEPASDSAVDKEAADYCDKWIFGVGRTDPFAMNKQDFLRHALLMVSDGVSAFEMVWGRDHDGHDVIGRFIPILPKTIWNFQFEDVPGGGLQFLQQRAWILGHGYEIANIRAEKLVLFVFGREGDNLFGWPILRAAYKPWFHKETMEIIDGIRIERNGVGFMVITVPASSKKNVRDAAKKVMTEMRANQRSGAIVEEGTKVEILYPSGGDPKIVESLDFRRSQILQVLISEFVEHGAHSAGSRALVSSKIEFLLMCLQGLGTSVCEVVNRQIVPQLIGRRWGWSFQRPTLVVDDISKKSGKDIADWMAPLATPGINLLNWTPETEQYIRRTGQLPLIPDDDMKVLEEIHQAELQQRLKTALNPPAPPPAPAVPTPVPGADVKPVAAKPAQPKVPGIPAGAERPLEGQLVTGLWRQPLPHEQFSDLPGMKNFLVSEPKRVWKNVVGPIRATMARQVATKISRMNVSELRKGRVPTWPQRGKLASKLEATFIGAYQRGRREVVAERNRFLASKGKSQPAIAAYPNAGDGETDTQPSAAQLAWVKTWVASFVSGMVDSMNKRGMDAAMIARDAGVPTDEEQMRVESAMNDLSENIMTAELAGDLNHAFVNGRNDQAMSMKDQIETAYYTAAMDEGTEECEDQGGTCALLDGDEHEIGDPDYATPNPDCAWPANCRCVDTYAWVDNTGGGSLGSEDQLAAARQAANPNHVPAGSPEGGQFTTGDGPISADQQYWESHLSPRQQERFEKWSRNDLDSDGIDALERDMTYAPGYEGTVYRGLTLPDEKEWKGASLTPGSVVTFDRPVSASKERGVAESFASGSLGDNPVGVVMSFNTKAGAVDIERLVSPAYEQEREVVIRAGSKFKVVNVEDKELNKYKGAPVRYRYVDLQEVAS